MFIPRFSKETRIILIFELPCETAITCLRCVRLTLIGLEENETTLRRIEQPFCQDAGERGGGRAQRCTRERRMKKKRSKAEDGAKKTGAGAHYDDERDSRELGRNSGSFHAPPLERESRDGAD